LRETTHLDDFDWETNQNAMVWFENGSLLCWYGATSFFEEHNHYSMIYDMDDNIKTLFPGRASHGELEAKILQTVTFLWSLKQLERISTCLITLKHSVDDMDYALVLASLQHEQLGHILFQKGSLEFEASRRPRIAPKHYGFAHYRRVP
jgi:hypothetical protein